MRCNISQRLSRPKIARESPFSSGRRSSGSFQMVQWQRYKGQLEAISIAQK